MRADQFLLGCGEPHWMQKTDVPLFVSRRRFARCKRKLPKATGPWALDSSGFTELGIFGRWSIAEIDYAHQVERFIFEIGKLQWAAPMDWMCEPAVLRKTGLTVFEHQQRTIESFNKLELFAHNAPWIPVLQGWELDDYLRHVEMYREAGIDLTARPLVGVGTVCRRQATKDAEIIIRELWKLGIRMHLFGFKLKGLARVAHYAVSADSMAWSYEARRSAPLPGCTHRKCANCLRYALRWREKALRTVYRAISQPRQMMIAEATC